MLTALFRGLAKIMFLLAGLAFFVGGRALHEFANVERVLAEVEGIGIAILSAMLGTALWGVGQYLGD